MVAPAAAVLRRSCATRPHRDRARTRQTARFYRSNSVPNQAWDDRRRSTRSLAPSRCRARIVNPSVAPEVFPAAYNYPRGECSTQRRRCPQASTARGICHGNFRASADRLPAVTTHADSLLARHSLELALTVASVQLEAPLVVVLGPTASGKTALSVVLAERFSGEIVNCDSVAMY